MNSTSPSNINEFLQRVAQEFDSDLAARLGRYFVYHQFVEWRDIVDDINNGYDGCCSKTVLFKPKQGGYLRLKECLYPRTVFGEIFTNIIKVFTTRFNAKFANNILKLFSTILKEEQFEDIESVKDDVDDIESSTIISHVVDHLEDTGHRSRHTIGAALKCIVDGKMKRLLTVKVKPLSVFDKIACRMQTVFIAKYNNDVSDIIISSTFKHMIERNEFHNPLMIVHDIEHILKRILNIASELKKDGSLISACIIGVVEEVVLERRRNNRNMNIECVSFSSDAECIANTILAATQHASIIYKHLGADESIDKDLIIAKSIDCNNKYPFLLCFIDMFNRDRIKGHKRNYLFEKLSYDKDRFATNYDVERWWRNDNKICAFVTETNKGMAQTMIEAMKIYMRRILPPLNLNHKLANTICDSLNEIAKITLNAYDFAHKIIAAMGDEQFQFAPIQFDVWIIPEATFDERNGVYNEMGKSASYGKAQNAFWNLETYLKKSKSKYMVAPVDADANDLSLQMFSMWNSTGFTPRLSKINHKRYIFIIDRRNPMDIAHRKVSYDASQRKTWRDTLYLILPAEHHTLTKQFNVFPEQCLGLSSKYLFPNPEKSEPDAIKALDALNGYKLVLSFHLFACTNCAVYFYLNQGATRFYLDDIKWLWRRFFYKPQTQTLSQTVADDIDYYNIYKQLPDDCFDAFRTQNNDHISYSKVEGKIERNIIHTLLPLIRANISKGISRSYFNILLFNYNVSKRDIKSAAVFVNTEMKMSHSHETNSLCIAKAIDIKNCKPIMHWLLNLYLKERKRSRSGCLQLNDWWRENKYCEWIDKTHPMIAPHMEAALSEFLKRIIPPINYNYGLFPVICDRLNDFAQYTLAFHENAHRIKQLMHKAQFNAAPIQIDCWIIPKRTRKRSENIEYKLCIADIEGALKDERIGYMEGKDYFVMSVPQDISVLSLDIYHILAKYNRWSDAGNRNRNRFIFIVDRRIDKMYMIAPKQYQDEKGSALCICGTKLNKVINDANDAKCSWCNKGLNTEYFECPKQHEKAYYLCSDECHRARPQTYGKLSKQWECAPELCFALSKQYVLFNPNHDINEANVITMNDSLNGYMFAISYHILREDDISLYWYHNGGATIFELKDIENMWPQCFHKIDGETQQLDDDVIQEITHYDKLLSNTGFQEFERQCSNIL